jgi:hypothetical protein
MDEGIPIWMAMKDGKYLEFTPRPIGIAIRDDVPDQPEAIAAFIEEVLAQIRERPEPVPPGSFFWAGGKYTMPIRHQQVPYERIMR